MLSNSDNQSISHLFHYFRTWLISTPIFFKWLKLSITYIQYTHTTIVPYEHRMWWCETKLLRIVLSIPDKQFSVGWNVSKSSVIDGVPMLECHQIPVFLMKRTIDIAHPVCLGRIASIDVETGWRTLCTCLIDLQNVNIRMVEIWQCSSIRKYNIKPYGMNRFKF